MHGVPYMQEASVALCGEQDHCQAQTPMLSSSIIHHYTIRITDMSSEFWMLQNSISTVGSDQPWRPDLGYHYGVRSTEYYMYDRRLSCETKTCIHTSTSPIEHTQKFRYRAGVGCRGRM